MYKCYSCRYRYKVLPENTENSTYVCFGLYGTTFEDAMAHADFWASDKLEKSDNMEVLSVTVERELQESEYPYSMEDTVKKALADRVKAETVIVNSVLDDYDKAELIANVRIGEPWRFSNMDTFLRDAFCEMFE